MNYNDIRRKTKEIKIGNAAIGGNNRILIQSMTNTDTHDADATIAQIRELEKAGCETVRIAVPDIAAAETVKKIKASDIKIPLVADIHFDYKIALACAENGVDKIRINPGNIGEEWKIKEVCDACRARRIPIRIGVNGGSLEKHILAEYGSPTPEALAKSAMYHVSLLEKFDFEDIVISIKSSNVYNMIKANKIVAASCDYPIHIGVTEAGSDSAGTIKNSIGIGSLICDGIGDTVRVSLTEAPTLEIGRAKDILYALNISGQSGMDMVCCPTCGRTKIDLIELVHDFEEAVKKEGLRDFPIKVALMGCAVNGPGEAKDADIGIAGGVGEAVLFKKGMIVAKIPEDKIIETLINEILDMKKVR